MKTPLVIDYDGLKARLEERHRATGSWRAVAAEFGEPLLSPGTVHAVARRGYEPKRADLRKRFGLTELVIVSACPIHHVVHPGRCPRGGERKPRRPRLSMPADNMEDAVDYLEQRLTNEQLNELWSLLEPDSC